MNTDITRLLDDPVKFPKLLARLASEAAADVVAAGHFTEAPEYVEHALHILATRHCRLVFECAQSPIERVWINSLQTQFLRCSSMLVTTPPIPDFPAFYSNFQRTLVAVDRFLKWHRRNGGSLCNVDEYLDGLVQSGRLDSAERDRAYCDAMDYGLMPYRHAFHVTLQAGFPKSGPRGKNIRIDALIWRPDRPDLRVAVECDGYAFHSSRQSFTQDRQRDRRLNALGVKVFRFSGSEINSNPPEAVGDLYDYLVTAAGDDDATPSPTSL